MKVYLTNAQDCVEIDERAARRAVRHVARREKIRRDLSIVYVDDEKITELNEQYLHHRGATDVISFDLASPEDPDGLMGEVVVSAQTAHREARKRHISIENEWLLYTIHGVLHLVGYDDQTPEDARTMRRRQQQLLKEIVEDR